MLLTTWTDANTVTETALSTFFLSEATGNVDGGGNRITYYRRIRTKSYKYVGLTEAAAKACVAEKMAQYIHNVGTWAWNSADFEYQYYTNSEDMSDLQCATVTATHEDGCMWTVTIEVDEDIGAYASSLPTQTDTKSSLEVLFDNVYGEWEYDE